MDQTMAKKLYKGAKMLDAKINVAENTTVFENGEEEGSIVYYEEGFMELKVINKETGENLFYQQITLEDDVDMLLAMQSFYQFLYRPEGGGENANLEKIKEQRAREAAPMPTIHPDDVKMPRILISCTSGASSSVYAGKLKQGMKEMGVEATVDAVSFLEIDQVQADYDIILLAPQVAYKQKEYRQLYGNKVWVIQTMDYATVNVVPMEEQLLGKPEV
jgi:PTS system cellobiose-specific IIB component